MIAALGHPQSVFAPAGPAASGLSSLGWFVLILLSVVAALTLLLLLWAAVRRKGSLLEHAPHDVGGGQQVDVVGRRRGARRGAVAALRPHPRRAEPPRRVLRVCADPNNLPFSNAKQEGFENRLAELVAKALGADLQYEWFPQRRGFVRQTLKTGRCDLVMGVPSGYELVATTRPYYRSGYALVLGPKAPRVRSLDAPELKTLRIGVPLVGEDGANPPPVLALAERKLLPNVKGYLVTGDYSQDSPPSKLIGAVRGGEVDVAVAWGPLAGYFARRGSPALDVVLLPMSEAPRGQTFGFDISMGVLRKNTALRAELDQVIETQHDEIARVLDAFAVPRLPLAAGSTP